MGAVAKSYMTNGHLIQYDKIFAHFLNILGSPSSYITLQSLHSCCISFFTLNK